MSDKKTDFTSEAEGSQESLVAEFWAFLKFHKKWWLTPVVVVLLLMGLLVLLGGSSAAPFIYTLF